MDRGVEITLPWPDTGLRPNARLHHFAKAKLTKAYREQAYWLTRATDALVPGEGELTLTIDFYPPDKRRRDLDGMFSSIKAALDGIADALVVDDQRFAFTIKRQSPVTGGKVVVSI